MRINNSRRLSLFVCWCVNVNATRSHPSPCKNIFLTPNIFFVTKNILRPVSVAARLADALQRILVNPREVECLGEAHPVVSAEQPDHPPDLGIQFESLGHLGYDP